MGDKQSPEPLSVNKLVGLTPAASAATTSSATELPASDARKLPSIDLDAFFVDGIPGTEYFVPVEYSFHQAVALLPEIYLYCGNERCAGVRLFETKNSISVPVDKHINTFVHYRCKNCDTSLKTYAVRFERSGDGDTRSVLTKYGERPRFGPRTPARLITLVGSEREMFLKGQRCEAQGMGIAAFSYYRRVIESKRNEIFSNIISVAKVMGESDTLVAELESAKKEQQFSKAVATIKHALPQAIMIRGQNPLLLLHSALSEGLHAQDDNECLELAHSVRLVLGEFVERVASALANDRDIGDAVNRLMRNGKPKLGE